MKGRRANNERTCRRQENNRKIERVSIEMEKNWREEKRARERERE